MSSAENAAENNNVASWVLKKVQKSPESSFIFSNEKGTEIYRGLRRKFDFADCVHIITSEGEKIAAVRRKYWAIKLTYTLTINDKRIAALKRTFDTTRISFTIAELDLRLVGEKDERQVTKAGYGRKRSTILEKRYLEYKFRLIDCRDNLIMEFYPDLETDQNRFFIKIYDKEKEFMCLCLVLAVYLAIDEMNRPDH